MDYLPTIFCGEVVSDIKFRGQTNSFSIGNNSVVLTVPKEVAEEFGIDTATKKSFFDIYTDYRKDKKKIVFEFTRHADKKRVEE